MLLLLPFLIGTSHEAQSSVTRDSISEIHRDTVVPQTFEYVRRGDRAMLLDVYLPLAPRPDSACVVYMYGGGFVEGSRCDEWSRNYCQMMAARGFVVVAFDYRLHLREVSFDTVTLFQTQGVFRDAINMAAADCAAALAFVYSHAAGWGVASNRIVLTGCSAGAIGVLQLDYCRVNNLPPAVELPEGFVPAAIVSYAGAVYADGGKPKYAGRPAPTFFLHGTKDRIVNYKKFPPVLRSGLYGSNTLQKVFAKNNYSHWIYRFEGIGHEVAILHPATIPEFIAFVDKCLAGREMFYDATVRDTSVVPTKWSELGVFDLYKK